MSARKHRSVLKLCTVMASSLDCLLQYSSCTFDFYVPNQFVQHVGHEAFLCCIGSQEVRRGGEEAARAGSQCLPTSKLLSCSSCPWYRPCNGWWWIWPASLWSHSWCRFSAILMHHPIVKDCLTAWLINGQVAAGQ